MTDGILLIDKPSGPTSHDVVHKVRRIIDDRRVGHAGTLDPGATGLLVVLVGRATRLARFIGMLPKSYTATVLLGRETTTDDMFGEPRGPQSDAWRQLSQDAVTEAIERVRTQQLQVPPPVSAKKVGGRRAYELARRGEDPELAAVPVTIYRMHAAPWTAGSPELFIEVSCSAGTYIRSIARDLGRVLGCGAHMGALRRTGIGAWRVADAMPMDQLSPELIAARWRPMSEAVAHLPGVMLHAEDARRFIHGQKLAVAAGQSPVAVFAGGELIGVAEVEQGVLKPDVVLAA